MVFPESFSSRLARRLGIAVPNGTRVRLNAEQFEELIETSRRRPEERAHFLYFGPSHVAAKILASSLTKIKNRQYFLTQLEHYESVSKVLERRVRAELEIAQVNDFHGARDFASRFSEFYGDATKLENARAKLLSAAISGLHNTLVSDPQTFRAVFTDMGVVEFLELKGKDRLAIWEIEHGQKIPVGIGLSMPSLIRLSTMAHLLSIMTDRIDAWLSDVSKSGERETILDEYGIELDKPFNESKLASKDEVTKLLHAVRHYCSSEMPGSSQGDTPVVKAANSAIPFADRIASEEHSSAALLFEELQLAVKENDSIWTSKRDELRVAFLRWAHSA